MDGVGSGEEDGNEGAMWRHINPFTPQKTRNSSSQMVLQRTSKHEMDSLRESNAVLRIVRRKYCTEMPTASIVSITIEWNANSWLGCFFGVHFRWPHYHLSFQSNENHPKVLQPTSNAFLHSHWICLSVYTPRLLVYTFIISSLAHRQWCLRHYYTCWLAFSHKKI